MPSLRLPPPEGAVEGPDRAAGGHPILELINTRYQSGGRRWVEALNEVEDVAALLRRTRLVGASIVQATLEAYDEWSGPKLVHEVRTLREVVRGVVALEREAVETLNGILDRPGPTVRLEWDQRGLRRVRHMSGGWEAARWLLADTTVSLVCSPSAGRIEVCESRDCSLLYLPGRSRRHCSDRCGARERRRRSRRRS